MTLPVHQTIDIVVPTLNEEVRLPRCLDSIRGQRFTTAIQVRTWIVDGGSSDRTREIAREWGATVVDNSVLRDPEAAKMLGLLAADGDYVLFLDADAHFAHPDVLNALVEAAKSEPTSCGAIGKYVFRRGDPPVNRALSMHPMQCDPIYDALVPPFPGTGAIEFAREVDIPPFAQTTLFRRDLLMRSIRTDVPRYYDVDVPVALFRSGHRRWVTVPSAGFYHEHATSVRQLVRKRLRNLNNGRGNGLLTEQPVPRLYRWIAFDRFGAARTLCRLAAAFSGIALLPRALLLAARYRDSAALMLLALGPLVGGTLLYGLLREGAGRQFLINVLMTKPRSN